MAINTIETRTVERNGEEFTLVKTQGDGENSRPNWAIILKPEDLEGCRLYKWTGPGGEALISQGLKGPFSVWHHNGPLGTNDDAFFEKLGRDNLAGRQGSGGKAVKKKLDAAQLEIAKLKEVLKSRGATDEEIEAAVA